MNRYVGSRMLANPPTLIAHADWSKDAKKRWIAIAFFKSGRYIARAPEPVGDTGTLLHRLCQLAESEGAVLIGFDFPIGLPVRYAELAGIDDFIQLLPELGGPQWPDFYNVAQTSEEISLGRPFYPYKSGKQGEHHQTDLVEKLGVTSMNDLLRRCERGGNGLVPASPLFWTLGPKQVGKAAIAGWRDMLAPALKEHLDDINIWPFHGRLSEIVKPDGLTVCETYPAEFYKHLGIVFTPPGPGQKSGKQVQQSRKVNAPTLIDWAIKAGVVITPELESEIIDGFGPGKDGEDSFDAEVGLFGMLNVVLGFREEGAPDDEIINRLEGWILGR